MGLVGREEEGNLDLWLLIRNQYNSYSLIKESVTIFVGLWLVLRYILERS